MVNKALLLLPQGLVVCIRKSQTSSLVQSSMGLKTSEFASDALGLRRSRIRFCSSFFITLARTALSAFLVPRTTMASPYLRTMLLMNAFAGLILRRSVHHLNFGRGAG